MRKSTDAHRHSSKLWQLDAEMLNVVPGRSLAGPGVHAASIVAAAKQMPDIISLFAFLHKSASPFQIIYYEIQVLM